jgi:hypothetical protein
MIGESRIADAILDRIVHNSHELMIEGGVSMRERIGLNKQRLRRICAFGARFIAFVFQKE